MKNTTLALLLLAPFAACTNKSTTTTAPAPTAAPAATPAPAPTAAMPAPAAAADTKADEEVKLAELTPAEVQKRLTEKNFFVFDNNQKERFDKGHVPGAKWADPTTLTATMLPTDKTATLVFYCANTHCSACHVGAQAALKLGYRNVFIMPEGIAGWESAKLPTETSKA